MHKSHGRNSLTQAYRLTSAAENLSGLDTLCLFELSISLAWHLSRVNALCTEQCNLGASSLGEWNSQQRPRKTCLRRLGVPTAGGRLGAFVAAARPGASRKPGGTFAGLRRNGRPGIHLPGELDAIDPAATGIGGMLHTLESSRSVARGRS